MLLPLIIEFRSLEIDYGQQPHTHFEPYSEVTSRAGGNTLEMSGGREVALDDGEWLPHLQPYIHTHLRTAIDPIMGLVPVGYSN